MCVCVCVYTICDEKVLGLKFHFFLLDDFKLKGKYIYTDEHVVLENDDSHGDGFLDV